MKIDLDWIQKELDAGKKINLECVDREEFKDSDPVNCRILQLKNIIATKYQYNNEGAEGVYIADPYGVVGNSSNAFISIDEFKYFRIKRSTPTFDDLVKISVKAAMDGVAYINFLSKKCLKVRSASDSEYGFNLSSNDNVSFAIDFINSLYTETFVIESEEDIVKARAQAVGVLANGNIFKVKSLEKCTVRGSGIIVEYNRDEKKFNTRLYIDELRGATVTQKRS